MRAQIFREIIRSGSTRRASKVLQITQSAVSQQLKLFEERQAADGLTQMEAVEEAFARSRMEKGTAYVQAISEIRPACG
ncbi:LysR family transcriptional regulator (plasmid) [Rhizobium laguerreae]|uniref:LysR family transcriptional regulator n=1 Tax=Rhizobium laguerreae TaxID=1076926 RepID=UPI001E50EF8C|nr:LysR family transcriptional regulator [Rhizobium laguerreae]UFW67094.1 LysR family transcriptional regulator [Rhizobium laguerreae]